MPLDKLDVQTNELGKEKMNKKEEQTMCHVMDIRRAFKQGTETLIIHAQFNDDRLSISGELKERSRFVAGGQIVDDARRFGLSELADLWERWHLNDMRAGTPAQEKFLRANPVRAEYPESYYEKASAALESVGLNPDGAYKYGAAWLREEVPPEVVERIRTILSK